MPPASATADLRLLFASRLLRMFAYGMLGVVLVLYLSRLGFDGARIGLLLTLTLLGDVAISLWLTAHADRWGRRKTLLAGAILMALGGLGMAASAEFVVLLLAATVGVISPSGGEVGPFQSVEQACLAQEVADANRTRLFAWYNLAGYAASALGALAILGLFRVLPADPLALCRVVLVAYAVCGAVLGLLALRLSPAVEAPPLAAASPSPASPSTPASPTPASARSPTSYAPSATPPATPAFLGLRESRTLVLRLSALFALDSLGGGFVLQSFLAWWLAQKFAADLGVLGAVFFVTNLLSGLSGFLAVPLAKRFGLINTMVWTHLPSSVLLMLVPFAPTLPLALVALFARHLLSQMDVPTRASYLGAVIPAPERAAANGVTATAKQLGTALGPLLAGRLFDATVASGLPFFACGTLKILYDLLLWRAFRHTKDLSGRRPV